MAHLAAANGVGFEIFQLIDPPHERKTQSLEYWKNGFFHICVTDPNVEELVEKHNLTWREAAIADLVDQT